MEPVSILQLASASASLAKTVFESVTSARQKVKGNKVAEQALAGVAGLVSDLQASVLTLQTEALSLQSQLAALQSENMKLREEVRKKEEGAAERERYELREIHGSVVRVAKESPDTYLCATCFEAGTKVYLTKVPRSLQGLATHLCPKCNSIIGAP